MSSRRHRILNVALSEAQLNRRSTILSRAGYELIPALNIRQVEDACQKYRSFNVVVIGHLLPKDEKRRVMRVIRQYCGDTPILEAYPRGTDPVDEEAEDQVPSPEEAEALVSKVNEIVTRKKKRRHAAS
jgi:DNA-binding NtrC family response regulator